MRDDSTKAAAIIRGRAGSAPVDVGLVLGSGLGSIADKLAEPATIPYGELPGFPRPAVSGHDGALALGTLGAARVAILKGRAHTYETGDVAAMRVPLETLSLLGAKAVVLTNAAGSTDPAVGPGSVVVIRDHVNLTGRNPLIGESGDERFVNLVAAYDEDLRKRFAQSVREAGLTPREGIYMWFTGPSFETPAEIRAARSLGADLVGMSTVPEVIIARRLALRVLAISMVTNLAAGLSDDEISHAQTKRAAAAAFVPMTRALVRFFDRWE